MEQNSQEEFEQTLNSFPSDFPSLRGIINQLWDTTANYSDLLVETPSKSVKPNKSARRFTPKELCYVRSIHFQGDDLKKIKNSLTITIKSPGKSEKTLPLLQVKDSNTVYAFVNEFCEWFEISCDALFKPKISKVSVYGCTYTDLQKYSSEISEIIALSLSIEKFKEDARKDHQELFSANEKLSAEIIEQGITVGELEAKISELNSEIETKESTSSEIDNQNTILSEKMHRADANLENVNNTINQLRIETENLNKEISEKRSELQTLTSNRNLISDEYGPYVQEGKSQAILYIFISLLPLTVIILSIQQLYEGAAKLLTLNYTGLTEIIGALLSRAPFAFVMGVAIYYAWVLSSSLFDRIFSIHKERLTLAKLLILARETVHSATKGLDITEEAKLQEQIRLKVEVLKAHLSNDLGANLNYTPLDTSSLTTPNSPAEHIVESPTEPAKPTG